MNDFSACIREHNCRIFGGHNGFRNQERHDDPAESGRRPNHYGNEDGRYDENAWEVGNTQRSTTKSAGSHSLAEDQKGTLNMEGTLRRFVVEKDFNQPDMAKKAYQHNQTDLEFLKSKEPKK